jgi:hypothetical protein
MDRQQLEHTADVIEMVLARHSAAAQVMGGHVTPRWVQFNLKALSSKRADRVGQLTAEIAAALGVPEAKVTRSGGAVRIEVPRLDAQPVHLAALLKRIPPDRVPVCTALLGLADDGAPLLARFPSPDVGHVLISGKAGSGKTSLMIAMLLSLAHYNKPRHVQIVAIGAGLDGLRLLHTDHLLQANDLQRLIERPSTDPRIIAAIDEPGAADLPLVRAIVERGAAAGVHCIVAVREPFDLPVNVRIVANDKPGDFRAAFRQDTIRFDAAYIAAREMASFIPALKG